MRIKTAVKYFQKIKNPFLILLSSFLLFLSYPKISISFLAWFALIPSILVLYDLKSFKKVIFYGFLLGFSFYSMILYWIVPTMRAANINLFLSIFSLLLLSLILSIEFIVLFAFSFKFKKFTPFAFAFIFSSLWVLIEYSKINISRFFPSFPWFSISYTQWDNLLILPYAYYGGIYGISYIIIFFQSLAAGFIYREKIKKSWIKLFLIFLIVIGINFAGGKIVKKISNSGEKISVAILQPSIDFYKKWNIEYEDWIKQRIEKLIDSIKDEKIDLIIWPENALPGWIDDREIYKWLEKNIKRTNSYHIVGSVSRFDGKYVSAFLINPEGEIVAEYNKRILVPFGEYVPFRNFLGKYIDVIGALGEFEPGSFEQNLFELKNFKIGQSICYESIFNYLFFKQAEKGADFFVNITNDGWYLDTSAPYQHLAAAILRAAENRKYFIRAANNGISAVISPYGKIEKKLDLNEYGVLKTEITKIEFPKRPFPFSSDFPLLLSLIVIITFFFSIIFI